jgi:hypothetical protein
MRTERLKDTNNHQNLLISRKYAKKEKKDINHQEKHFNLI